MKLVGLLLVMVSTLAAQVQDTNSVRKLNSSAAKTLTRPDSSIIYSSQAIELAKKINWKKGEAIAIYLKGCALFHLTRNADAIEHFKIAVAKFDSLILTEQDIALLLFYKRKRAFTLSDMSSAYSGLGNYTKTMECLFKALRYFEEIDNKTGISLVNGNIGLHYREQKDYKKAESYLWKAVRLDSELGNVVGICNHYVNLGNVYADQGIRSKAIEYYSLALKKARELGDSTAAAGPLGDIGTVYSDIGDSCEQAGNISKAKEYYNAAIKMYKGALAINILQNDLDMAVIWHIELGTNYGKMKQYAESEKHLLAALKICEENGVVDVLDDCLANLSQLYVDMGKYEKAYRYYRKHIILRDSMFNAENTRNIIQSQVQYDYDKKQALSKLEQDKKDAVNSLEKRKQQVITAAVSVGLFLTLILVIVIFRSLNQNKKKNRIITEQKHEVEKQKDLVEEKQKEIIDSINYAKRLQGAILTSESTIRAVFKESFILFKPKDIVSGDFYWILHIEDKAVKKNIFVFAAADCTGHGVPGAFMSMLNSTLLNQTAYNPAINTPADALNFMNRELPKNLRSADGTENIQDGMDIAFCLVDLNNNILKYAGANNPCWMVRNGQLTELKPLKQAITASTEYEKKMFVDQEMPLQKGDCIYVFTDGYADQFGGPRGKKFKEKALAQLILSINDQPMEKQKAILEKNLSDWRGDLDQVDDVCVIGIRI